MTLSREEQFCVYLHNKLVGRLHRRDDVTRFVFDEGYWNDPNRAVLGLRFEEDPHARHRRNMRLPPWFSNLLPEGRLREWIAQARHTSIELYKHGRWGLCGMVFRNSPAARWAIQGFQVLWRK